MSETIILVAVLSNMILTPIIQYVLSSRCTEIECCCMKCKREPIEMNIEDVKEISNNNNNNQK
jgi:hypothetical protein